MARSSSSGASRRGRDLATEDEIVEGDAILSLMMTRATPRTEPPRAIRDSNGAADNTPSPARVGTTMRRPFGVRRRQFGSPFAEGDVPPPAKKARTSPASSRHGQAHAPKLAERRRQRKAGGSTEEDKQAPSATRAARHTAHPASQTEELRQQLEILQKENEQLKLQNRELTKRNRALQAHVAEWEKHCGLLV